MEFIQYLPPSTPIPNPKNNNNFEKTKRSKKKSLETTSVFRLWSGLAAITISQVNALFGLFFNSLTSTSQGNNNSLVNIGPPDT